MKKTLLIYLLVCKSLLFGCATCVLMSPTAQVNLTLDIKEKNLSKVHTQWVFTNTYIESLLVQYDKNRNKKLDPHELKIVKKAKIDYLLPKGMVTEVGFTQDLDNDEEIIITPQYTNFSIRMIGEHLYFSYDMDLNISLQNNSSLSFVFEDDEGWFTFSVAKVTSNTKEFYTKKNLYLFTSSILFVDPLVVDEELKNVTKQEEAQEVQKIEKQLKESIQEKPFSESILKQSVEKIKALFKSIKNESNPLTYLSLLLFAYIYGLVHALGPGHGKTLVASYFLSHERSYSKALSVSLAIGIVHTFSAFILTFAIYYSVDTLLSQFVEDTIYITTKISALIIILIAVYLFYVKYKAYKQINAFKVSKFTTQPHINTCGCSSCKVEKNSTDFALIVSAGIVPCPGTTTIFIFSLSLGLYYVGFIAALVMSLGMSTIIFFSAILSTIARKKTSQKNENLKKYLEYLSLAIIFTLGILLLFA